MKIRALTVAAIAVVLPLGAVACSSDSSGGGLEKADIKKALVDNTDLTDEQVDCITDKLVDVDLDESDLEQLTKDDIVDMDDAKVDTYLEAYTDCTFE